MQKVKVRWSLALLILVFSLFMMLPCWSVYDVGSTLPPAKSEWLEERKEDQLKRAQTFVQVRNFERVISLAAAIMQLWLLFSSESVCARVSGILLHGAYFLCSPLTIRWIFNALRIPGNGYIFMNLTAVGYSAICVGSGAVVIYGTEIIRTIRLNRYAKTADDEDLL